jgi:hypothetical protein
VPASFSARYRVGAKLGASEPGSLQHFLAERYLLYADWGDQGIKRGQVHHTPYPLHAVDLLDWKEDLFRPAGLPAAAGAPVSALYSPGVEVDVFSLKKVADAT